MSLRHELVYLDSNLACQKLSRSARPVPVAPGMGRQNVGPARVLPQSLTLRAYLTPRRRKCSQKKKKKNGTDPESRLGGHGPNELLSVAHLTRAWGSIGLCKTQPSFLAGWWLPPLRWAELRYSWRGGALLAMLPVAENSNLAGWCSADSRSFTARSRHCILQTTCREPSFFPFLFFFLGCPRSAR